MARHMCVISLAMLGLLPVLRAQEVPLINSETLAGQGFQVAPEKGWRVYTGPLLDGASVEIMDAEWQLVGSILRPDDLARISWDGYGWFRISLEVAPQWKGQKIGVQLRHIGASRMYLNGVLVNTFGTVGKSKEAEISHVNNEPFIITLGDEDTQVLSLEFSNYSANLAKSIPKNKGFALRLADPVDYVNSWWKNRSRLLAYVWFFFGFFLMIFIFHGFLFFHLKEHLSNLFVALIGLLGLLLILIALAEMNTHEYAHYAILKRLQQLTTYITYPLLLHYAYAVFKHRSPKSLWFAYSMIPIVYFLYQWQMDALALIIQMVILLWTVGLTIQAIRNKCPGGWTIGIGILVVVITVLLEVFNLTAPLYRILNPQIGLPFFGALVFMTLISLQASRSFSQTSRQLAKELKLVKQLSAEKLDQEREARKMEVAQKLLEADNLRKTQELEEARRLQLSMLPKKLPDHPCFEIAAFMETATEVGGDYYDFYSKNADALTIAIGDATGHGSKAGTMVAAVKGLFGILGKEDDLVAALKSIHAGLRTMHMRRMFMALTLLKVEGYQVRFSVAGMPPLFILRGKDQPVEMIQEKALPLGSAGNFPYREKCVELKPGDHLVLMSDGLPEMFNSQREMLGEAKVKEALKEMSQLSAGAIVEALRQLGETWRGEHPQDDDVTLMVLKAKPHSA